MEVRERCREPKSSHGTEQGPRRLNAAMAAVLGVARIQIAQEADPTGPNRWICARVVDLVEEYKSGHLVARTCTSDQSAMSVDPFLRIRMVDRQFCRGGRPSET